MDGQLIRIFMLSVIACPFIAFSYSRNRFLITKVNKFKAIVCYFIITILPVLVYLTALFSLIGIEELSDISIVSEMTARSTVLGLATGLIVSIFTSIIFTVYTVTYKVNNTNKGV